MKFDTEILRWLISQYIDSESVMRYDEGGALYFSMGGDLSLRYDCSRHHNCIKSDIVSLNAIDPNEIVANYEICGVQLVGSIRYMSEDEVTSADAIRIARQKLFVLRYLEKNKIQYDHYWVKNRGCDNVMLLWGADPESEFGYFIDLNESVWQNRMQLQLILNILSSGASDLYSLYSHESIILKRKVALPIIGTNTKVRRLGYIKKFIVLYEGSQRLPEIGFERRVHEKLQVFNQELLNYKNTKGIIQETQFKSSLRPYLDLASSLGILTTNRMGVELGKFGIVFQKLLEKETYGFNMTLLDKSLFLETLLKNDYLYMYIILEYAFVSNSPSYHDLRDVFQRKLLDYIDGILEDERNLDSRSLNEVILVKKRIQEWSKPNVYLEHVLMPRLNWLFDLDLIDLYDNLSFTLTKSGESLLFHLVSWMGLNFGHAITVSDMIEKYFMRMFDEVYVVNGKYNVSMCNELLEVLLRDSFGLFKTLAPNRVTYSMFVGYVKRILLFEYGLIMDEQDIKNGFLQAHPEKYIFNYQEYYHDGYVQLKQK